jgi:uncharacterized protein YqfB (UPF0267 family)
MVRKEHSVGEDTSKPTNRYQIVDAIENAFKAGYKWEVLDTETDNIMCATPIHELAELMVRLLNEHAP